MTATATLSPCGTYRYLLTRTWHEERPKLGWVMLNPSTADADRDDPTIRRCCGLAAREGYGGIVVANLVPYRATRPDHLRSLTVDQLGDTHAEHLAALWRVSQLPAVVLAWGTHGSRRAGRRIWTVDRLKSGTARLLRLGELTANGQPRHPLYVPGGVPLVDY